MSTPMDTQEASLLNNSEDQYAEDDVSSPSGSLYERPSDFGPEVLNHPKYNQLLNPFGLKWVFGFNVTTPIVNLELGDRREIFYAATNVGVLYDFCKKEMAFLKGHQNKIVSVTSDSSGKWLATADVGTDGCVMIWDSVNRKSVLTIFNYPPPPSSAVLVAISPSARFLVTVASGVLTTIDVWLWTYGRTRSDDSFRIQYNVGLPKSVQFHPNKEENIVVIFEKSAIFFTWNPEEAKLSPPCIPDVNSPTGLYTDGTFVDSCHECFVSSSKGKILKFGNTLYSKPYDESHLEYKRVFFINAVKISKVSIASITSIDGIVVTGDCNGTIMFFDKRLRLLYWFSEFQLAPIVCLSFKKTPRKYKFVKKLDGAEAPNAKAPFHCGLEDRTEEYELLTKTTVPLDASLGKHPLVTRDFFMCTNALVVHRF